jgi:hypothetical protein
MDLESIFSMIFAYLYLDFWLPSNFIIASSRPGGNCTRKRLRIPKRALGERAGLPIQTSCPKALPKPSPRLLADMSGAIVWQIPPFVFATLRVWVYT